MESKGGELVAAAAKIAQMEALLHQLEALNRKVGGCGCMEGLSAFQCL